MNWRQYIPILSWLPSYGKTELKGDLSAGLTVGILLIPQGMAYAMIAGLPPIYGLYASLFPLVIYAILGTSRQLAVGPVAMDSLLVAAGIGAVLVGMPDTDPAYLQTYIELAILLAFMVGLIQLMLGVLRMGFLVNFISHPVISGFTSAAALIIGFSQLPNLLGIEIPRSSYVHEVLIESIRHISDISIPTVVVGLVAMGLLILLKKWKKNFPAALLAVMLGILVVWLLGLEQDISIIGTIPQGLVAPEVPTMSWERIQDLMPLAITMALIGFMEAIAIGKAMRAKHKNYKLVPNQELVAIGLSNMVGSLFKGFPVTGGFSRTAVNDQAGAKTGMASIFSAGLILVTLLFLTPLFYFLPKAVLAAMIMLAVLKLLDWKEAVYLWKSKKDDFVMLLITFLATLFLGIQEGILIGVALSLGMVIFRSSYPHIAVLGLVPGTTQYRNVSRFKQFVSPEGMLIVRLDSQLYFANLSFFREKIDKLLDTANPPVEQLILDAGAINAVDSSAIHGLEDLFEDCKKAGIGLYFTGVKGPVRDVLEKGGFATKLGEEHFFLSVHDAVLFIQDNQNRVPSPTYRSITMQTN
jgi:SulP family sulfate permease